jgi:hypothetical protein
MRIKGSRKDVAARDLSVLIRLALSRYRDLALDKKKRAKLFSQANDVKSLYRCKVPQHLKHVSPIHTHPLLRQHNV